MRVEGVEVLQRSWPPLADLRRDVAQRLHQAVGPWRGGFLVAHAAGHAFVLLVLVFLPWLQGAPPCRRGGSLIPMATALLVHGLVQFADGLVAVSGLAVTGCWLAIVGALFW